MKTIIRYLTKQEWMFLGLCGVFALCSIWTDMSIPDQMSKVTTLLQTEGSTVSDVTGNGVRMLLFALLGLLCTVATTYFSARVGAGLAMRVRGAVFDKILDFSPEDSVHFSTSSLITRCTNDIVRIQTLFAAGAVLIFKAPLTAVWAFGRIVGQNPLWTAAVGVVFAIVLVFIVGIAWLVRPQIRKAQALMDDTNRVSREHLSGIRVIHAFHAFDYQKNRFETVNEKLKEISSRIDRRIAMFNPFLDTMTNVLNVAIYCIGAIVIGTAAASDRIGLFSEMVTFSSYTLLVMTAFVQLLVIYMGLVKALASIDRISEVLNTEIRIRDGANEEAETAKGTVEFKHVTFRYPNAGDDALTDISFSIKAGQTVAFIGATGSGKTSILNLIPRFYDVTGGQVLVGGKDVRDYKLKDLRNKLGYIPQRSILFSGTIADNIAYGDNGRFRATLTEIKHAAEVGQAKEFIEKKEGGYEAKVSEGGKNFSGGQRQRLTISRAIARDPEIYLFDDSFSALDFKTDRMLRDRLKEVAAGATVIIVAQRIGTIRGADQIFVVDQGRIVGSGTHDTLMETCPVYQEIALSQDS